MNLSNLSPAPGSTKRPKRIGRGVGSGKGGHSSTRGNKGQKSRSGNHRMPAWFEGGQMPLQRRVPKFGFKNPFRVRYRVLSIGRLAELVESGRLDAAQEITPEMLCAAGQARKGDRIKILGDGKASGPLTVEAHAFSRSALQKIEASGGKATVR